MGCEIASGSRKGRRRHVLDIQRKDVPVMDMAALDEECASLV